MGGCGKSSASKSNSYTPKKMSSSKGAKATSSTRGGFRSAGTNFGSPKVKMSFSGGRGR
jgi:hypothetical protein